MFLQTMFLQTMFLQTIADSFKSKYLAPSIRIAAQAEKAFDLHR